MDYLKSVEEVRGKIKDFLSKKNIRDSIKDEEKYEGLLLDIAKCLDESLIKDFNNKDFNNNGYIFLTLAIYSYLLDRPVFSREPVWNKEKFKEDKQLNANYTKIRENYYDSYIKSTHHLSLFEFIFRTREDEGFDPPVVVLVNKNNVSCKCNTDCSTNGFLYLNVEEIITRIKEVTGNDNGTIKIKNGGNINEIRNSFQDNIVMPLCECLIFKEKTDLEKTLKERVNNDWDEDWFHSVMCSFVLYAHMLKKWDYVYYIPASFPGLTIGGLIIGWEGSEITDESAIYLKILASVSLSMLVLVEKREKVKKHAVKSALSAIIARNHSHHIGSHVTSRTFVKKIEDRLKNLCLLSNENDNDILGIINNLKTRLDEYIQQKADFMAEIATEPLISTRTASFFREVVIPFVTNTLLMDNIASNEGISYKDKSNNRLKIMVSFNGKQLDAKFKCSSSFCSSIIDSLSSYPYHGRCLKCSSEIGFHSVEGESGDFDIALPGPLGEHAFYSFLENFIRNAAKHNREGIEKNNGKDLEIHIDVSEITDEDIKQSKGFFKEEDKDEFYKIEIWDNFTDPDKMIKGENLVDKEEKLVDFLGKRIEESIIESDGSPVKKAWGISEMKIMATLLAGSDDFMELQKNLQVKKMSKTYSEEEKDCLVYCFKLMKPKKVVIFSNKLTKNEERIKEEDKKGGVWWFNSVEDFKRQSQRGSSLASFEFAVIDKEIVKELKGKKEDRKEFLSLIPFRIFSECNGDVLRNSVKVNNDFIDNIKEKAPSEKLTIIWKKWINYIQHKKNNQEKNNKQFALVIYLQQKANESPTREWVQLRNSLKVELQNSLKNDGLNLHILSNGNMNLSEKDNPYFLMYDRHFRALDANKDISRKVIFHEIIDKNSSDFIQIFSKPKEEIIYGLIEAGILNVLIIDERVVERAYDDILRRTEAGTAKIHYNGHDRIRAFKKGGVFICTHIKQRNNIKSVHHSIQDKYPRICLTLNDNEQPIVQWGENGNKNWQELPLPDILIIHYGIMKDLNLKIDGLRNHIPYIIIVSGRGIPPDLSKTEKFMPFSLLEKWVMKEGLSKYRLVNFLMSLKRRKI